MKKNLLFIALFFSFHSVQSQVLMSLIFGDKLNSPNIEFGLEGGANFSTISNLDSDSRTDFNLGFYFDFNMKNPFLDFQHWGYRKIDNGSQRYCCLFIK